ncbi:hypothetical protein ACS245_19215, partial [Dickeya zeae]|uniref:hypothetical protein n=1 Tax=Dickeya zeae TaxID=204042 RepID=UPI003F2525CB
LFLGFRVNDRVVNDRLSRVKAPSERWLTPGLTGYRPGGSLRQRVSHFYSALITLIYMWASSPGHRFHPRSHTSSVLFYTSLLFCVHENIFRDSAVHRRVFIADFNIQNGDIKKPAHRGRAGTLYIVCWR